MKTIKTTKTKTLSETGLFCILALTSDGEDVEKIISIDDMAILAERFDVPVDFIKFIVDDIAMALRDAVFMDLQDLHKRLEKLEKKAVQ